MNGSLEAQEQRYGSPCHLSVLAPLIGDDCRDERRDAGRQGSARNPTGGAVRPGLAGPSGALDVEREERHRHAVSRDSRVWFTEPRHPQRDRSIVVLGRLDRRRRGAWQGAIHVKRPRWDR